MQATLVWPRAHFKIFLVLPLNTLQVKPHPHRTAAATATTAAAHDFGDTIFAFRRGLL
jgi:hypothetical protein